MPDYSPHQRRIIDRYYEHKDVIMLNKLQELVSELYLAETDKKRDGLWKRVAQAMTQLKVPPSTAQHILTQKKPELLATQIADWMKKSAT